LGKDLFLGWVFCRFVPGERNIQGKFYTKGIRHAKSFLFVLLPLCQVYFACGDVPGELSLGNFWRDLISAKKIPWKGGFLK
jgi:hypothetical protein